MVTQLGAPFATATCPTHKVSVTLNKRGECPICFTSHASGKTPANREACPVCGDTRKPGRHGCLGCYANQRKQECAASYVERGIATTIDIPVVQPKAAERWPAFEIGPVECEALCAILDAHFSHEGEYQSPPLDS
jgi:hypothetical protein